MGKRKILSRPLNPSLRLCLLAGLPAGLGLLPTPGTSVLAQATLRISHTGPECAGRVELGRSSRETGWAEGARQTLLATPLSQLQQVSQCSACPSLESINPFRTCGIRLVPGSLETMARGTRVPTQLCASPLHQLSLLLPRPARLLGKDHFSPRTKPNARGPGSICGSKVLLNYGQAVITHPRAHLHYMDTCVQRCCRGQCWRGGQASPSLPQAPRPLCRAMN